MQHARRITEDSLDQLMYDYQTAYLGSENELKAVPPSDEIKPIPRLHLAQPKQVGHQLFTLTDGSEEFYSALVKELRSRNVFHQARVLDYDWSALTVGVVEGLKSEKDFYGYAEIKKSLSRHFQKFSNGELMCPLILFGPSGTGKTQLVHTYTLRSEGVTLIRASPWVLDKIDEQLEYFGKFAPKKIVLLVDDLEAEAVTWSKFRGIYESGGRFQPPANVLLAITSNDDFPENVKSRGLCLKFPNVSSPEEGYGTALGIIKDYIGTIGFPSHIDQRIYAAFVVQDFYHGAVPKELAVYWSKEEINHPYELSPRGLLQYLKNEARRGKIIPKCWEFQQRQEELSAAEREMGLFDITSRGKSSVERMDRRSKTIPIASAKAYVPPSSEEPPSEIEFTLEEKDDKDK